MKITQRTLLLIFCLFVAIVPCNGQGNQKYNLDFEKNVDSLKLPVGWHRWGKEDYQINIDSLVTFSGRYSIVINSPNDSVHSPFGCIYYKLPGNFLAQTVTLNGYMKTKNVSGGFAGLLLRVDGEDGTLAFDNMQRQNIHGTNDWKLYKITLPYSSDAKNIYAAGILKGKGKAWFDKFEVYLDDKNISTDSLDIREPKKADLDKEFDSGSNIKITNLTDWQTANLVKVAKVWGFLKYYHPAIANGNFNWDYELIRMIPEVIKQEDPDSINIFLKREIDKLGKLPGNELSVEKNENIKLRADIDWIKDDNYLGRELSSTLIKIRDCKKPGDNYYIALVKGVSNPEFKNERTYSNMSFDDDGIKLTGLFRYWNMIEYYYPYRYLIQDKWDSVLKEFIPKIISADDDLSYKLTLLELIGKINDTHANIWGRDEALSKFWGLKAPPIQVVILNKQVVISKIFDEHLKKTGIRTGDIILKVNDIPVEKLISDKIKYCPASNLATKYRDLAVNLLRTNSDSIKLSIKGNVSINDFVFKCKDFDPSIYWNQDVPAYKILKGNIGYIYPGSLQRGQIDTIMQKLKGTKGLIIDLRCYPSDFIVFSLGKYLMPKPTSFVKFTSGSLYEPGEFDFTPSLKVGENREDYYKGKIIIIVNAKTQSQAEYTTMALRVAPKAIVIGSTTAGADGNVSTIILPGNVRTMISGIGVYYPDGTETQRVGIVPDIKIKPTIEEIRNGTDGLLNKAIELINTK
jgi:C-terminal processing protease CtpA/Prc